MEAALAACLRAVMPDMSEEEVARLIAADEKAIEIAAKKPPPKGSSWAKWKGTELEPYLAHMQLIDAKWLLDLALANGVVPAYQNVPPEAVVHLDDLRASTMPLMLPVAVLSYGWAARHHPDETGAQLQALVPALQAMVRSCTEGVHPYKPDQKPKRWGVVWDFMSLPQRGYTTGYVADVMGADGTKIEDNDDRTPYERTKFAKGLKGIKCVPA